MRVHWTDAALGNLTAIHQYIARNSPHYALRVVDRITHRTKLLADFPRFGAVVPYYEDESIRELLEYPYRIIYRILPGQIDIVGVVHGAQQLPPTLPE